MEHKPPSQLSDTELVAEVALLAHSERRSTAALIAYLAELDARRLHLRAGFPSLFVYCTQVLRLSEGGAYNRIEAARAARKFPIVLDLLKQGGLNLATLRLVAPQLTPQNHGKLLEAASFKSKREVEELLARLFPRADVAASVRKLPAAAASASENLIDVARLEAPTVTVPVGPDLPLPASSSSEVAITGNNVAWTEKAGPARRLQKPLVLPLASDRYQIRFTASASTCEKLRRAQDLLRHAVPDGDPAEIFDRALTALLGELARRKFAATERPRASRQPSAGSRAIPAAVKRSVAARDQGRCAFVAADGRRCGARGFVEFHHVMPYARGGPATEANIQLRCRGHNDYEAELDFCSRKAVASELVPGRVGSAQRQVDRAPDVLAGAAFEGHP
jgi:hypothetical protein